MRYWQPAQSLESSFFLQSAIRRRFEHGFLLFGLNTSWFLRYSFDAQGKTYHYRRRSYKASSLNNYIQVDGSLSVPVVSKPLIFFVLQWQVSSSNAAYYFPLSIERGGSSFSSLVNISQSKSSSPALSSNFHTIFFRKISNNTLLICYTFHSLADCCRGAILYYRLYTYKNTSNFCCILSIYNTQN